MTATAAVPIEVTADLLTKWATDPAGPVALHLKPKLLPVTANEDEPGIIYPPTYADIGYSIDTLADGTRVALIDSVGSQANRLEPIFKGKFSANGANDKAEWLVPQIEIILNSEKTKKQEKEQETAHQERRSLLDLAHRSADAVVQSCPKLKVLFDPAFESLRRGDSGPLCKLAPTSLVFGVWDSRGGSGEKRPRLVRSVIRAWDVDVLHAAAQFNSVWKALDESQQEALTKDAPKGARVRILPLPSIGHDHADHAIRRILVEVPAGCLLPSEDVYWAFSGLDNIDTNGELHCVLTSSTEESMLKWYGLTGPGYVRWRTITPAVLSEVAKRRRIEPTHRTAEAKHGAERANEQQRAAVEVIQALRHAELPTDVDAIQVRREPFEANGERVEMFAPGTRFQKERLWHVELTFRKPLSGPLIFGDGRYYGLGLMAPVHDNKHSQ